MDTRETVKKVAWRVVPGVMADRARRYEVGVRERTGLAALGHRFMAAHGDVVLHGPVASLRLKADRLAEIDAPVCKLLGSYEEEIHPALTEALATEPRAFIDLGAADGYFAVGIARHVPEVHAFEISANATRLTWQTAELNGVAERLMMHTRATSGELLNLDLTQALVLCDIDGPERNVFGEDVVRHLHSATVIVEMHEIPNPDVVSVLTSRFAASHGVQVVEAVQRDPARYPELEVFSDPEEREHAVNELRYRFDGRKWLIARPH